MSKDEDEQGLPLDIQGDGDEVDDPDPDDEGGGGELPRGGVVHRLSGGRRRRNAVGGRPHRVQVRLTGEEFEAIAVRAAAGRVGVAHYVALRAMDAPTGGGVGGRMDLARLQSMAVEMFALRRDLNRVGVNLNQIARLLNGTGEVARGAEATLCDTRAVLARVGPVVDEVITVSGLTPP